MMRGVPFYKRLAARGVWPQQLAAVLEPEEEFVNMADEAARRRELRRRRILENAEERKRKIFGASITASDTTLQDEAEGKWVSPAGGQETPVSQRGELSMTWWKILVPS